MINLIRGDMYRLCRTRGFWLFLILISSFMLINTGFIPKVFTEKFTSAEAVNYYFGTAVTFYVFPVIFLLFGSDMTNHTVKITFTNGGTRTQYYVSRLASSGFIILLGMLLHSLLPFLFGLVCGGLGDFSGYVVKNTFYRIMVQWLLLFAMAVFGSLLFYISFFLTDNGSVSIILTICTLLFTGSNPVGTHLPFLKYFALNQWFKNVLATGNFGLGFVGHTLMGVGMLILICGLGGNYFINHLDI